MLKYIFYCRLLFKLDNKYCKMEKDYLYDVYMLCPVRNATDEEKKYLLEYKKKLEEKGFKVHYSAETPQEDETGGYGIVTDHCDEILNSKTVHIYWNPSSQGSYVDLGSSLIENRRRGLDILLMKKNIVRKIVDTQKKDWIEKKMEGFPKSYEMVLLYLDSIAEEETRISLE